MENTKRKIGHILTLNVMHHALIMSYGMKTVPAECHDDVRRGEDADGL